MIILLILIVLTVGFYILTEKFHEIFVIGFAILITFSILYSIFWPLSYFDSKNDVIIYQSTKATIEEARKSNMNKTERMALISKIIDVNENIASAKYWNKTIFGCWICDELTKLEPLK